jgi:hypothetical protein
MAVCVPKYIQFVSYRAALAGTKKAEVASPILGPLNAKILIFRQNSRFLRIFSGVRISFDFRHVRPSVLSCKSTRFPFDGLPLNVTLYTCTKHD